MIGHLRGLAIAGLSATALTAGWGEAQAGAFAIREQSAQAQGLAFAGAASGSGGVSSMFWNPATVTMAPGFVKEQNLTFINLSARITPQAGTSPAFAGLGGSGDIGQGAIVPAGATSYQLNDRIWLGLQTGAPFGLVTKPRNTWAGEVYGRSNRIFSLSFNPVIGYKVNEWLSVAAGPNIEYFRLTLRQATGVLAGPPFNVPTVALPSTSLKGDSWGVGFTAGALITAPTGTTLGVGYRSSVHHEIEGAVGVPLVALAGRAGQVRANFNTPEKVTVGLTQAINPVTRVSFGFEWDNWSRAGDIGIVQRSSGLTISSLPLNYKDGFTYSVGAEYDWSPNLTVRGGVAYEISPIDFENRSVRLPDSDRFNVSLGASYRWNEKLTLLLAYSHLFLVGDSKILAGAGRDYNERLLTGQSIAFAADTRGSADIVSVGFRYVFGEPVRPVAPIVRKY
ncbi:outer membrane protein transport protein [Methylobacterium sp. Leaf108]|uniref:OmpP1/FadL family transporter n=1 Tax=Methylobacterium sp. Leaf108 TaxID=1736256 RepID=UPI0006F2DD99|nr:outer membrane protein transport protein [Methylobacterium sp. Leaf108]KQP52608.1 aromatic hydrocarbon degradation protein [Methylobacterium sp. Leaf108]